MANDSTVLGNFSDAHFTKDGVTSTFFKKDGKFYVRTDGPDGKPQDYDLPYTFGVYPLQQYLVPFPNGRIQSFVVAWDSRSKDHDGQRWFHLYPDQKMGPTDPLHWTGRNQTWNYMCADCHSTNLRKNYDLAKDSYDTKWSEIDVSCETCHGPGSNHVAWAQTHTNGSYKSGDGANGLVVDLKPASGTWASFGTRHRNHALEGPAPLARRDQHLCALPLAPASDHQRLPAGTAFSRRLRAEPAGRRRLLRGRPDPRGRLRVGLVPAEQDVSRGRDLLRLPRSAHREAARRSA